MFNNKMKPGNLKICFIIFTLMCISSVAILPTYVTVPYENVIVSAMTDTFRLYRTLTLTSYDLPKTGFDIASCNNSRNVSKSLSIPPHYPLNGTASIPTHSSFDLTKVNKICQTSPPLEAILPVYSASGNQARRVAIRNTTSQLCEKFNCKLVFIVAFPQDGILTPEFKAEYDRYGDIVIVNKIDTYRDLNDKAVAMLDWLIEFCSQPKYVIHFVDDAFVNIKLFLEDLGHAGDAVYGYIVRYNRPIRDNRSKYYVSKQEYPYMFYPNFIVGVAYGFPNSILKSLRCAVHDAIYNWLEDVWLMGHVREQAGIKAVQTKRKVLRFGKFNMNDVDEYLFLHSIKTEDFYKLYHILIAKDV